MMSRTCFGVFWWFLRPAAEQGGASSGPLVLVAHEASVMDLFSVDPECLAGVAVEHGSSQSHAAILARSLGIPMVGQAADLVRKVQPGQILRVDEQRPSRPECRVSPGESA